MKILVIEDDLKTAQAIRKGLLGEDYDAFVANSGEEGLAEIRSQAFDLVLLDWMLPGRDGIEILKAMRAGRVKTPVLLLTARDAVEDRVLGLDSGADDYLIKPFAFAELVARIRVLLRRSQNEPVRKQAGDLVVDFQARRVWRGWAGSCADSARIRPDGPLANNPKQVDPKRNSQGNMTRLSKIILVAASFALAGLGLLRSESAENSQSSTPSGANPAKPTDEIAALRAEVDRLKGMVPDQSHAMKDVAYHFGNLWFAGQKANWPLAEFYWSETRSHLRWAVRIIPIRKDPKGNEIRLADILDPIDRTSLQQVGDAIKAKDTVKFTGAYKQMLESCYSCHLAAGKPYLRLQVPQQPEVRIIKFDAER